VGELVQLSLRVPLRETVEVDGLTPDRLLALAEPEIAALPAWTGSRMARVGDFFTVRGGRSARVRVEGALGWIAGLGEGMTLGELVIDGDAGPRVGAGMTGGSIEVRGCVGDEAGLAMQGGVLRIGGDAGDRLGAALPGASRGMTGGEIVVRGSAGVAAAARVRRGLVAVAGDVAERAGEAMIAGTLVVFGRTGPAPGRGSKRGSVVACGEIAVPDTYRYACTFNPSYVRLLMIWLRRHHRLAVDDDAIEGRYRRYCGDGGRPGRGEILALIRRG
jgi:formylmethanofuran dehydrogenase subunit C